MTPISFQAECENSLTPPSWLPGHSDVNVDALTLASTQANMQTVVGAFVVADQHLKVLTWPLLEAACNRCPTYKLLRDAILAGCLDDIKHWDLKIQSFFRHRHTLTVLDSVVLVYDRPVIPARHLGASTMFNRASHSLF